MSDCIVAEFDDAGVKIRVHEEIITTKSGVWFEFSGSRYLSADITITNPVDFGVPSFDNLVDLSKYHPNVTGLARLEELVVDRMDAVPQLFTATLKSAGPISFPGFGTEE